MGKLLYFPTVEMVCLHTIGLRFPVPDGAKFIDYGNVIDEEHSELWGTCTSQYSDGEITVEVAVNGLLPRALGIFARGHEEGHAAFYLGSLNSLKRIANDLGVRLGFLTEEYCATHDKATRRFLRPGYGDAEAFRIARRKPHSEREMIAHIGGLAALVKFKADQGIIEYVRQAINRGDLNAYPQAVNP